MESNVKLSVIIPCLNGGATLATQLEALSAQQWSEPWELIISDNGSTDNSLEIARKYNKRFFCFRVVDASDLKRQSHALNVGVRAARSDKVAFCDVDDEVAPGWVAAIGDALCRYEMVHGQFRFDKFNSLDYAERKSRNWKDGLYVKGLFLPGGGCANLGVRRWVHEAIGGFDESIPRFEDSDYWWKLQLEGFKSHYVPDAEYQVRAGRVNPSLSSLYRRGRTGAAGKYWIYKRYRLLGMQPLPPLWKSFDKWLRIIRGMPRSGWFSKQVRVSWLERFVEQTGDLVGQFHGRITNPCKPYYPAKRGKAK
ncbi:MAG: glycosyltransferase family 2 protein [Planctomycetes bacterium]|nr:glycosyltransferase family 2 protein [Planctomycetota bacterium]